MSDPSLDDALWNWVTFWRTSALTAAGYLPGGVPVCGKEWSKVVLWAAYTPQAAWGDDIQDTSMNAHQPLHVLVSRHSENTRFASPASMLLGSLVFQVHEEGFTRCLLQIIKSTSTCKNMNVCERKVPTYKLLKSRCIKRACGLSWGGAAVPCQGRYPGKYVLRVICR